MTKFTSCFLCLIATALFLSGCEEEKATAPDAVRALKTITLTNRAQGQTRLIAGIVEAATTSELSFEVGGRVTKFDVEVGDRVKKGDLLAELDPEPFALRVTSAQNEVVKAQASLRDAEEKHKQQKSLYEQGFATKTAYDAALATYTSAQGNVEVARAAQQIAARDLRNTKLLAPFSGRISEKYIEKFADVTSGSKILQMQTEGGYEIAVSLPDALARQLGVGDEVSVRFPTLQRLTVKGKISEIGSRAGTGSTIPTKVVLNEPLDALSPGLSAEVLFTFDTAFTGKAFAVPHTALLPSKRQGLAYVFLLDPNSQTVKRVEVRVSNIRNNTVEILSDLKAGQQIASAGLSFLTDGMKVKLLPSKQAR